eukprot:Blabericola_migrator_1__6350@NODE_31_length_18777_cov_137_037787_g27_i0_p11_GENE_NODE_31_length_18777_cov_137_037787_g27_i0NODE_31_length_18777_cov_137_037787_g27_i0_p11_ORF_typecomplete_len137_score33_11DNA_pol_alpha_N/PF12254_8/8_1e06DNA_pol_alpha_N/PF12254_8/2_9e03DUF501/PF04417_12/9_5DUF501/PF04417_12/2_9YL1/PF05764_13/0_14DUF3381/PF11861_8/0_86DUF3381/PF11861_8/5_3e03SPT6_acidic/PF14632_6/2_3e02SPT6_acidic/PF14632_6/7_6e02_NODE_31_length_18777_cov_137_037787_g27_i084048814
MRKSNYRDALNNLKAARAGIVKATEAFVEEDQSLIREVDEEEFDVLKSKRSVKGFIVSENGENDRDFDEDEEEDLEIREYVVQNDKEDEAERRQLNKKRARAKEIDIFQSGGMAMHITTHQHSTPCVNDCLKTHES